MRKCIFVLQSYGYRYDPSLYSLDMDGEVGEGAKEVITTCTLPASLKDTRSHINK